MLENKTLVLIFNPDDKNWGSRGAVSLAVSKDNGKVWDPIVEIDRGNNEEDDEFSYPSVISFGDTVAFTYTWQRQRIAFWMGTIK